MKKYINQSDMKQANTADIFSLIRKSKKITRKEIEAKTGFSWGAVSTITSHLLEKKYISEFKCSQSSGTGRIPSYLEVNTKKYFVLGIDINISGFKAVVVDLKNQVKANNFYKAKYNDKESLLCEITKFIRETINQFNDKNIICIGIAMQGMVDAKNGISISIPHLKDWKNVPLSYIMSKEFGIPVFIEHDPDCILYAVTSEKALKNAILLRIDDGIGMSVLMDKKIFKRPGMFEIGHTVAVPNGKLCSCGKKGCLEAYASIKGMSSLAGIEFEKLVQNAGNGDDFSEKLFLDMSHLLALKICDAAHMLSISKIVLCGDMCQYKDLFFDNFIKELKEIDEHNSIDISFIDVENAAKGAALTAIEQSINYIDFRKEDE